MSDRAAQAETLRELHRPGEPLILVNVWDVASARTVAGAPGCAALATASWAIAAAHGYADGEEIPLDLMLAAIERIAGAVELPVTADIEAGYGDSPEEVSETIARAIAAGAVGVNLEDELRLADSHAARVAAARERGEREGVPLVINARSDEYLLGEGRLDEAIARGRAYLDAGADCFFIPGITDLEDIRRLTGELAAPVNVLAMAGVPSPAELAEAGVARISIGPGGMRVAYAALADAAEQLLGRGDYPPAIAKRPRPGS
jgi:2-methylisocitrate lyase-like PEP mutase family enzyme